MATEKAAKPKTKYCVFLVEPLPEREALPGTPLPPIQEIWTTVGETDAHGSRAAIVALATEPGDYRAVPVSNITAQAMGREAPPPPKLVPVDPNQLEIDTAGLEPPPGADEIPEPDSRRADLRVAEEDGA